MDQFNGGGSATGRDPLHGPLIHLAPERGRCHLTEQIDDRAVRRARYITLASIVPVSENVPIKLTTGSRIGREALAPRIWIRSTLPWAHDRRAE